MHRTFLHLALASLLIAAGWHIWQRTKPADDLNKELKALKQVLPQAESFSPKGGNPACYEAYRLDQKGQQELVGLAFLTTDLAPEVKGYAGPIKVMAGITPEGKLSGIAIISHRETPSYVQGIEEPWFKDQFKGKTISDPFKPGEDLDGISRATVTVSAIARGIKKSGVRVASERLGLKIALADADPWRQLDFLKLGLLAGLLGAAVLSAFYLKPALRYACLILAVFLLGFFHPNSLSMVNVANLLTYRLPEFVPNLFWYLLIIFVLAAALIWGRIYCGYLCPFGAISEFIDRLGGQRLSLGKSGQRYRLLQTKYIILWLTLLLALFLLDSNVADYEPFSTIFTWRGDLLGWLFLGAVLLACLFIPRFFCRYLCAVGGFLGLLSGYSLKKLRIEGDCRQCRACQDLCPVDAIQEAEGRLRIKPRECIQCHECRLGCPQGSIGR